MKRFFLSLNFNCFFPLALLMICMYYLSFHFQYFSIFLFVCISFLFFPRKESCIAIIIYILLLIPIYTNRPIDINSARIIDVKNKYIICKSKNFKFLIYTDEDFYFDSIIQFEGEFEALESDKGFYRFNAESYYGMQDIYYELKPASVTVISQLPTLRYFLQKYIYQLNNIEVVDFLKYYLLNIRTGEYNQYFSFSYIGIIYVLNDLLSYFYTDKKREKVILIVNIFLCLLYRFPLVLVRYFIKHILSNYIHDKKSLNGVLILLLLLIYRKAFFAFSTLIYLAFVILKDIHTNKIDNWFILAIIQSIIFSKIDIISIVFYSVFLKAKVALFFYAIILLFLPIGNISFITSFLTYIENLLSNFILPGNLLGFGMIPFIILISFIQKVPHKMMVQFLLLLVFQYFGLFHPLGEVTLINVGQGDCILIREPLNRNNILIDTGKNESYRYVKEYLHAKGIRKINYLFISHHDSDHDGSLLEIQRDFNCDICIDKHFDMKSVGNISFYDLNEINNENLNQSSLVLFTKINYLNYLFTGDADEYSESRIIEQYKLDPIDILKVGHHGSKTSSSQLFLDDIKPSLALISCGNYQKYHHPSPIVLKRLKERNIDYLTTKEEGDISIIQIFKFNLLITSNNHISFIYQ